MVCRFVVVVQRVGVVDVVQADKAHAIHCRSVVGVVSVSGVCAAVYYACQVSRTLCKRVNMFVWWILFHPSGNSYTDHVRAERSVCTVSVCGVGVDDCCSAVHAVSTSVGGTNPSEQTTRTLSRVSVL